MSPAEESASVPEDVAATESAPAGTEPPVAEAGPEQEFADDPVDTKLDLARAYLDMGDPVGARAMLEEVLEEGSQIQKDEARRLLADVAG
jgi:pilus assembly protein FimV